MPTSLYKLIPTPTQDCQDSCLSISEFMLLSNHHVMFKIWPTQIVTKPKKLMIRWDGVMVPFRCTFKYLVILYLHSFHISYIGHKLITYWSIVFAFISVILWAKELIDTPVYYFIFATLFHDRLSKAHFRIDKNPGILILIQDFYNVK